MLQLINTTHILPAHVRWFVEFKNAAPRLEEVLDGVTLLALAVAGATLVTAWLAERLAARWGLGARPGGRVSWTARRLGLLLLDRLYPWLPLLLAAHTAGALLAGGLQHRLFAPNLALPHGPLAGLVALAEIVVALHLLVGALTRLAAVALLALAALGMALFGPLLILEHSYLLGIAAFLLITGRGPLAVDRLAGAAGRPWPALLPHALPLLRVATGLAVAVAGFSEKLWNRELAMAFLRAHPFNVTAALPVTLDDAHFVVLVGVAEVALGALLISGLWTRPVALLALVPFTLAVPFLGWVDLVGHLPIIGILLVLFLGAPGREFATALCVGGASSAWIAPATWRPRIGVARARDIPPFGAVERGGE